MTFTRHLHISLAAAPLTPATPAFALNAQPLPPGTRFDPGLVNHAQVAGVWNRGPLALASGQRVEAFSDLACLIEPLMQEISCECRNGIPRRLRSVLRCCLKPFNDVD